MTKQENKFVTSVEAANVFDLLNLVYFEKKMLKARRLNLNQLAANTTSQAMKKQYNIWLNELKEKSKINNSLIKHYKTLL